MIHSNNISNFLFIFILLIIILILIILIFIIISITWKDEETIRISELDTWGKPGAIGYNLPMKWGTAGMFIDMGIAINVIYCFLFDIFLFIHFTKLFCLQYRMHYQNLVIHF